MTAFFDSLGERFPDAWQETIGKLRADIAKDRADTYARLDRMRSLGAVDRDVERHEWQMFTERNRIIEQEIERLTKTIAAYVGLQPPSPLLVSGDL